ncbi:uncharacterized protein ACNS7B_005851 isoform 1-T1 [Menidia menidia]
MDQAEELEQIAAWTREEGLGPDASVEARLCLLWHVLQHTRSRLSCVTQDLERHRSQHHAELAEVRKSLEQIRFFTEHKDVLAQEIQDENDQLREQLRRIVSIQDAQLSEVAKMLYQQGLTELIHSSPSEQVAYLLVERTSLLELTEDPDKLTGDGKAESFVKVEAQAPNTSGSQCTHKRAPRHLQGGWKRLLGLNKATQSKHAFIPAEARPLAGDGSSLQKACSRLERDLEEGSRRLAMAHKEIRRLTDELESAHLTRRAYEPELQSAQQEVVQLRQEVEKLKKYEMAELRKAKDLNDRLELEIRALKSRVRSLDAERSSLQQIVVSLQVEAERMEQQVELEQAAKMAELDILQKKSEQLEQQQNHLTAALQANQECHVEEYSAVKTTSPSQHGCETLKKEFCETLKCLDKERSKYHNMKAKQKEKLLRAKEKYDYETTWRDEQIKSLEREMSLCSHSLAKQERELVTCMMEGNEKLLSERRRLLEQLNEEQHNKEDSIRIASLSKCRVDFLEMENRKLGNKILHMSNQIAVLERSLQNLQSQHFAEELHNMSNHLQIFAPLPVHTSSFSKVAPSETLDGTHSSHTKQTDVTTHFHCSTSGALRQTGELGYLNLTSTHPLGLLSSSVCAQQL